MTRSSFLLRTICSRMPKRSGIYCRCCRPSTEWGPRPPFPVNSNPHSYRSRMLLGVRLGQYGTIYPNPRSFQKCRPRQNGRVLAVSPSPFEGKLPEIAGYTQKVDEGPQLLVDWQGFCKMLPRYWSFLGIGTSRTATGRPLRSRRLLRSVGLLKNLSQI
jgi:hypothetical protein